MLEARYKSKEEFLEMQLEWALVPHVMNIADMAANQLVTERTALQLRLDQVTAAFRLKLEAGLAAGEWVPKRGDNITATEHHQ